MYPRRRYRKRAGVPIESPIKSRTTNDNSDERVERDRRISGIVVRPFDFRLKTAGRAASPYFTERTWREMPETSATAVRQGIVPSNDGCSVLRARHHGANGERYRARSRDFTRRWGALYETRATDTRDVRRARLGISPGPG